MNKKIVMEILTKVWFMKTMTLDQKEVLCENNSRKVNNKILSVYSWINVQDHILFHSSSLYPCRSLYQSGLANFDIINISKLSVSLRPVCHYYTSKLYKEVLMVIKLCMRQKCSFIKWFYLHMPTVRRVNIAKYTSKMAVASLNTNLY